MLDQYLSAMHYFHFRCSNFLAKIQDTAVSFSDFFFQGAKTGKDNGYTMLFDIESFDYSYYDEGSEGLKVALVHHLDMPIMRQTGFHIAPGTENQIAVTPTLIVTSNNAMHRFTPAERDCYSEDEISLKYLPRDHGYRYEMSNCLFESAFEYILHECKCYPGKQTNVSNYACPLSLANLFTHVFSP